MGVTHTAYQQERMISKEILTHLFIKDESTYESIALALIKNTRACKYLMTVRRTITMLI